MSHNRHINKKRQADVQTPPEYLFVVLICMPKTKARDKLMMMMMMMIGNSMLCVYVLFYSITSLLSCTCNEFSSKAARVQGKC